jgi:pimeloyl-ACP methyl ester carboxylesterase
MAFLLAMHVLPVGAQEFNADSFAEFQFFGPQKAFAVSSDQRGYWWAGANGASPNAAVNAALKACEQRSGSKCNLYAVNNIALNGREWTTAAPPLLPAIGRLHPQPWWKNKGPQGAAGLIVWSHGYLSGSDATSSAPQPWIGLFTATGYDLYRFDRQWIHDWPGDATQLADAVRQAKALGYRRVLLAGQSAGGWVSLAAAERGAPVDGVISIAPAHHGEVKDMRDVSIARFEWQQIVRGIKAGPRLVIVDFAGDAYDVGGRMEDAISTFSRTGVQADVISSPAGFTGHGAGSDFAFARKFGPCIQAFIEQGVKQAPC